MKSATAQNNESSTVADVHQRMLAGLPVVSYRAGDAILTAGSKTGRLLILKSGAVVIRKDGVELATVDEPGAILGELSFLLDRPHTTDVQALGDSDLYAADAILFDTNPDALSFVARTLALRLVAANEGLVKLKRQLESGQSPSRLRRLLDDIELTIGVGGSDLKQWM